MHQDTGFNDVITYHFFQGPLSCFVKEQLVFVFIFLIHCVAPKPLLKTYHSYPALDMNFLMGISFVFTPQYVSHKNEFFITPYGFIPEDCPACAC